MAELHRELEAVSAAYVFSEAVMETGILLIGERAEQLHACTVTLQENRVGLDAFYLRICEQMYHRHLWN